MPEMDLRQPGFTQSDSKTKNKERIQKFKQLVFNMTWLMETLMIQLEEQRLVNIA